MRKSILIATAFTVFLSGNAFAQDPQDRKTNTEHTREKNTSREANKNTSQRNNQNTPKSNTRSSAASKQSNASAHKFAKGHRFERPKAVNYRRIDYRENRKLSAPPRGYVWVRAGNDALLVRLSSNLISRIVYGIF